MRQSLTYSVDVSWSELVDFLDEKYLELLCKRLHVTRDDISRVHLLLSSFHNDSINLFNVVEVNNETLL